MNNYQKIATIFVRTMALFMMLYAIIDIGILATGILLMSLEIFPRDAFAHEIYFVQIVFFLLSGVILFARSKALGNSIAASLEDDNYTEADEADDNAAE